MLSFIVLHDKEEEKPIIYKSRHYIECYWRSCSDYAWLGDTQTHTASATIESNRLALLKSASIWLHQPLPKRLYSALFRLHSVLLVMWFSCVTINQFIIENWFIFLFALCPIQTDSELLFSISASIVCAEFIGRCWHNQKQRGKKERMRTSLFEALQLSALYNVLVAFHWTQYPPQNSIQTSPLDNWTTETLIWENFVFAIRLVIFSSTSIF